jgi:hypothetical protein
MNKKIIWSLLLMIVVAALYRVIPGRPYGFAPQIAMALFGGAVIKDRKWAFALPLFSMFISDLLYAVLFAAGISELPGFYDGQLLNYIFMAGITFFGFLINKLSVLRIAALSIVAPTAFFLVSNFATWIGGGGYQRPKNFSGLMQAYADGVPFYTNSIAGTLFFSIILFGGYYLLNRNSVTPKIA